MVPSTWPILKFSQHSILSSHQGSFQCPALQRITVASITKKTNLVRATVDTLQILYHSFSAHKFCICKCLPKYLPVPSLISTRSYDPTSSHPWPLQVCESRHQLRPLQLTFTTMGTLGAGASTPPARLPLLDSTAMYIPQARPSTHRSTCQ